MNCIKCGWPMNLVPASEIIQNSSLIIQLGYSKELAILKQEVKPAHYMCRCGTICGLDGKIISTKNADKFSELKDILDDRSTLSEILKHL